MSKKKYNYSYLVTKSSVKFYKGFKRTKKGKLKNKVISISKKDLKKINRLYL